MFDLDRTIIGGATAAVFQRHLHHVGIGPAGDHPVVGAFTRVYEFGGESWLSMQLTRRSARLAKGWPESAVHTAAVAAAEASTAQELTRTYPPGYHGDATKETERRPGVDTVTSDPGGNR